MEANVAKLLKLATVFALRTVKIFTLGNSRAPVNWQIYRHPSPQGNHCKNVFRKNVTEKYLKKKKTNPILFSAPKVTTGVLWRGEHALQRKVYDDIRWCFRNGSNSPGVKNGRHTPHFTSSDSVVMASNQWVLITKVVTFRVTFSFAGLAHQCRGATPSVTSRPLVAAPSSSWRIRGPGPTPPPPHGAETVSTQSSVSFYNLKTLDNTDLSHL